jgi:hypothetical protein
MEDEKSKNKNIIGEGGVGEWILGGNNIADVER